jgi:uncharacterized membrane protein
MRDRAIFFLTFAAALSTGMVSGVFFGFSTFVMQALGRLPPPQGIAAFQSIDVVVEQSLLMPLMFGAALVCLILMGMAFMDRARPDTWYLIAGAVLYLVGNIIVTGFFNIPLNKALVAFDASSAEGARFWADFMGPWMFWNHVRTITGCIAAALFMIGLLRAQH